MATLLAVASSFRDAPIGSDLAAVGEVGLSGEVRSVQQLNLRLSEIARLGFKRCIIPAHIKGDVHQPEGLELVRVKKCARGDKGGAVMEELSKSPIFRRERWGSWR